MFLSFIGLILIKVIYESRSAQIHSVSWIHKFFFQDPWFASITITVEISMMMILEKINDSERWTTKEFQSLRFGSPCGVTAKQYSIWCKHYVCLMTLSELLSPPPLNNRSIVLYGFSRVIESATRLSHHAHVVFFFSFVHRTVQKTWM